MRVMWRKCFLVRGVSDDDVGWGDFVDFLWLCRCFLS